MGKKIEEKKEVKVKKRKKNYFDNKLVETMIIEYQKGGFTNQRLLDDLFVHLNKIVLAIINKYHFYLFYEYDDLVQEGRIACLEALKRFDLNKVKQKNKSAFSYFSNVVKRNLRFFTLNKNKKLYKENLTETFFGFQKETINTIDDDTLSSIKGLISILKKRFVQQQRMLNLVVLLERYIFEISYIHYSQKDFIAYCKSFGYTSEYVKKFLNKTKKEFKKEFI